MTQAGCRYRVSLICPLELRTRPDGAWGAPPCPRGGGLHTPPFCGRRPTSTARSCVVRAAIAIGWGVKSGVERMAVGAGGAVLIPPGVRHRAGGLMPILNVEVWPFDPADEWCTAPG